MKLLCQIQALKHPVKKKNCTSFLFQSTQNTQDTCTPRNLKLFREFRHYATIPGVVNTSENLLPTEDSKGSTFLKFPKKFGRENRGRSRVPLTKHESDAFRLLRTKTKSLSESRLGSWSLLEWEDAMKVLYSWTDKNSRVFGSAESVVASFALLERSLLELKRNGSLEHNEAVRQSLNRAVMNSIVSSWSLCWIRLQGSYFQEYALHNDVDDVEQRAKVLLEFTVESLLSRIDAYKARSSGLLVPNKTTYDLIADAAAASYKSGQKYNFALQLLDRIWKESEESLYMKLDYATYAKFIRICANVGDAKQAEDCLEHMYKEFSRTGQRDLKPDTRIFNKVLLAWSQSEGTAEVASKRSQSILKRMKDLSAERGMLEKYVEPDCMSYSLVIKCLSNWLSSLSLANKNAEKARSYEYIGERAETLLQEMKEGASRGNRNVRPNAVVYNNVLHVWSLLGNAERAEKLLQVMYDDFKHGNDRVEPNIASFTTVLTAWSKFQKISGITSTSVTSSNDNRPTSLEIGERAEAILRRMEELQKSGELRDVEPNAITYLAVLHCWANTRSNEAGGRAAAVFREMEEKSNKTGVSLLSAASYKTVLQAYAGSGDIKGAEAFFGRLTNKYREGNVMARCTVTNLNIILNAWSRSNDPEAPFRAESLLEEMWSLWKEGVVDRQPDVVSYSTVLDCYAKSSVPGAAERAEKILDEMINMSKGGDVEVRPNVVSYRHVIHAYARVGNVDKTEKLVEKMFDDFKKQKNLSAKPNRKTLDLVLAAYANSDREDAAVRAEKYLRYMQDLHARNLIDERPNVVSYTLLLKTISRSNSGNAGQEAERIIDEMEDLASSVQNGSSLLPNTMSWSTAIQACARAGEPEKAEALLERMYKSYREGNVDAKPNTYTFTNVLQAWSQRGDGADRALAIFKWMKELHSSNILRGLKPNNINYAAVLGGLAKKRHRDAAEQALRLLQEMEELAAAGDNDVQPNGVCYNNTINAFANIGDAQKAQELIARMYLSHKEGRASHKPSLFSWNILLGAWSRSSDPRAAEQAESVLKRMYELYDDGLLDEKPNPISYTTAICCWAASSSRSRCDRVVALLDQMDALKDSGDPSLYVTMHDYNVIIRVLCDMKDDKLTSRAEIMLRRMLAEFDHNTPKWNLSASAAFNAVINAWRLSKNPDNRDRAKSLHNELHSLLRQ